MAGRNIDLRAGARDAFRGSATASPREPDGPTIYRLAKGDIIHSDAHRISYRERVVGTRSIQGASVIEFYARGSVISGEHLAAARRFFADWEIGAGEPSQSFNYAALDSTGTGDASDAEDEAQARYLAASRAISKGGATLLTVLCHVVLQNSVVETSTASRGQQVVGLRMLRQALDRLVAHYQ